MCNRCLSMAPGVAMSVPRLGIDVGYAQTVVWTNTVESKVEPVTFGSIEEAVSQVSKNPYYDYVYGTGYKDDALRTWEALIRDYKRNRAREEAILAMQRALSEPQEYKEVYNANEEEQEEVIDIRKELKKLGKNKDDVLLEEYGMVNSEGELTDEGMVEVLNRLLSTVKTELVADLKTIDDKKKSKARR